ncbi:MAG: NYN domain-containing protein [Acidobacteria bacterium]|nr:NYN domain-containing protein [Acidobacteriota bacterium]
MKKAVAFIDGENFYHKISEFGDMKPWFIDWDNFFKNITPKNHELIRTYYYKCEKVSPYDFNRPLPRKISLVPPETPESRKIKANEWYNQCVVDYQKQLSDYEYNIACRWSNIEIKKVGTLKVDPWSEEILGEKGLDVGLAVDMLEIAPLTDSEILVSGDADYAPAVKCIKSKLKKIYLVRFFSGPPPRTKGTGTDLLTCADETIDLYEEELWKNMVQPMFLSKRR